MTYVPKPEWLNLEWHHATLIAGSLCIQRCGECGRWRHPPRRFCPACSSTDADFAVVSGTGTVISYAVSHRSLDPEWQERVPFSTLVVELDEGQLTAAGFGVDLLTALPAGLEEQVAAVIAGGARLFVAGLGVPRAVIEECHRAGVLVGNMCGKVRHAKAAVAAGCDIIIALGTEAGGHTGTVATMPLVPQVVDAIGDRVPAVAAGGIYDGRGLAAALALDADGV